MPIGRKTENADWHNIDMVFCIDISKGMLPFINEFKDNASSFHESFTLYSEKNILNTISHIRVKIITFCNQTDGSVSICESRFFTLDKEKDEFCKFVYNIEVCDTFNEPTCSLEAIALAMKSDWVRTGSIRRHFIIMFTDALPLPLGAKSGQAGYPAEMPKDLAEFKEWWDEKYMEKRAKRLLVFAPDAAPWSDMWDWTNVYHTVSKAGDGCSDTDMRTCFWLLGMAH